MDQTIIDFLSSKISPKGKQALEKYLQTLTIQTNVIGDGTKNKGATLKFKSSFGGGRVQFNNVNETVEFCTALGDWAKALKKN